MAECAREAELHNDWNSTETETKVKPSSLNDSQMTFCFDRGTKRQTPLKGKYH